MDSLMLCISQQGYVSDQGIAKWVTVLKMDHIIKYAKENQNDQCVVRTWK